MARGRMLDITDLNKYIRILKPELFPSLPNNVIEGFEKLLILSNRDGLVDLSNVFDNGLIYTIDELAGSCAYKKHGTRQ
jgi:hypothetical protein